MHSRLIGVSGCETGEAAVTGLFPSHRHYDDRLVFKNRPGAIAVHQLISGLLQQKSDQVIHVLGFFGALSITDQKSRALVISPNMESIRQHIYATKNNVS